MFNRISIDFLLRKIYTFVKKYCNDINTGEMYCICFSRNGDSRILINYGLFYTKADCNQFIKDNLNDNAIFYPYKIKVNTEGEFSNITSDLMSVINSMLIDVEDYHYNVVSEILDSLCDECKANLKYH